MKLSLEIKGNENKVKQELEKLQQLAIDKCNAIDQYLLSGDEKVKKQLKSEPNVCCVAITDDATHVVFGVMIENRIKVWDTFHHRHKIIPGYGLQLTINSKLHVLGEAKAVLLADEASLWDLDSCALLSIFTPDSKISCLTVALDRKNILMGMSDSPALITLKTSHAKNTINPSGRDLFREEFISSEEEHEEN